VNIIPGGGMMPWNSTPPHV